MPSSVHGGSQLLDGNVQPLWYVISAIPACPVRPESGVPRSGISVREAMPRRAAEQSDELAPFHSITSSARASSVSGTSRPSAFAVLRLITVSYLFGA